MSVLEIDLSDYTKVLRNQNAYKNGNINGKLNVDALSDLNVEDTKTVDLTLSGDTQKTLSADVKIATMQENALSVTELGGLYVQDTLSYVIELSSRISEMDYKLSTALDELEEYKTVQVKTFEYPDNANFTERKVSYLKQGSTVTAKIQGKFKAKGSWVNIAPFEDGFRPKSIGTVFGIFAQNSGNLEPNNFHASPVLYCNDSGFMLISNFSRDINDWIWNCSVTYLV